MKFLAYSLRMMDFKSFTTASISLSLFLCVVILSSGYSFAGCNTVDDVSDQSPTNIPKIFDYEYFKSKFHKSYSPMVSMRRASLFISRTIKIFQHNYLFKKEAFGYHLAQSEFTDLTGQELLNLFGDEESELEPVREFSIDPDAPADSVLSVERFLGIEEGYSSCAIEDLDSKSINQHDNKHNEVKPMLSFFEKEELADTKTVIEQLETRPEVAEKISRFVDLKKYTSKNEEAKLENKIKYKPMVNSNNDKYEVQMKPSRATGIENDYWMLDDDDLFEYSIRPYPSNVKISSTSKSFLSNFFDKISTSMVNFWVMDIPFGGNDEIIQEIPDDIATEKIEKKSTIEYKIDWRESGCIGKPGHQRLCNSCYAFATLSLLEYYYCKQNHESTSFSPQYLIDCGEGAELKGCDGGKITNTGMFIKKYGLELESMYPYLAKKEKCPFDSKQEDLDSVGYIRPQITHWQRFDDLAAWYRWIRKGPVVVGINMPTDFFVYGGGVHDGLNCDATMTHALLLVGFGIQDGKEFWLLKNSYSPDWGEEGYFKLSARAPVRCFNSVVVARVKFNRSIRDRVKAGAKVTTTQ